ncbi:hypothetical protein VZQ01_26810 [Myxococcus faecalis]|uniref:hypothetical protein n=1 Tax=Myxococcus faecalis TaxID=3115646 RepID=UPI003CE9D52D
METKISATLLDYASPLFEGMPPSVPLEQRRSILQVAITVWNALVTAAWGGEDLLPDLYRRLDALPEPGRSTMRATIDMLVARKRQLFARDLRGIGAWELRQAPNGDVSLWAEARAPRR